MASSTTSTVGEAQRARALAARNAAQATTASPAVSEVGHEEFCIPSLGLDEPRVEAFITARVDPRTGQSTSKVRIVRCVECGAQRITPID